MKQVEEFKQILELTANALGVCKEDLTSRSRKMHLAIPRAIACVIGMKDASIKKEIVANVLNRHRTATYHYLYKHEAFFKYHAPYRNGYIKVLKEYKKIDANKEVFISKQHFQMFVGDLNFVQSKQPDIVIELNSKKYKHLFYSDCFNFTEHIKDIKKHFEGFKHTIKYKTYEG